MIRACRSLDKTFHWLLMALLTSWLTACATTQSLSPAQFETIPTAISTPYIISSHGRFIINVEVNNYPAQPFVIDTAATVSAINKDSSINLKLKPSQQTVLVRGLVTSGLRPVIENIDLKIGPKTFSLPRIAALETLSKTDEAIGLLGTDILKDYIILFNKDTMRATLVPSKDVDPNAFLGWHRIPLRNQVNGYADKGLLFTQIRVGRKRVPVLIDTGSNSNFVNWHLARFDDGMRRLQHNLRKNQTLQGAIGERPLEIKTNLYDLTLGDYYWNDINVIVTELDSLSTIAPTDKPMMIAGAALFNSLTIAFDFGRQVIYILPESHTQKRPKNNAALERNLLN